MYMCVCVFVQSIYFGSMWIYMSMFNIFNIEGNFVFKDDSIYYK